jgi:hypothetical protein
LANGYLLLSGWHIEPAPHGTSNGFDVIVGHNPDGKCELPFPDLDRAKGDIVEISIVPMQFDKEAFNANIVKVYPAMSSFKRTVIPDDIQYLGGPFTPKVAGAWGWVVSGIVQKKGYKPLIFSQKFVCGKGSRDLTPPYTVPVAGPTEFHCVE